MSALADDIDNRDWPRPNEYDWALQNRQTAFHDHAIQHGALKEIAGRPAHLNGGGSKYVCVYKVGTWVVRCFAAQPPNIYPPSGIIRRYQGITSYLQQKQKQGHLPFLAEHIWVPRGVNINGKDLPFLKVPYIENSQPLGDFLMDHVNEREFRTLASSLANQWLYIASELEKAQIAHGDLDMTNILVHGTPPNIALKLIDFDGMYVPTLAKTGLGIADNGHAHFQPVEPELRQFGPTMDRFSALIIYLSLCALAKNPALWENCEAEENRALLGIEDFKRLGLSKNFIRLRQESYNTELQLCLDELQTSVMQGQMPRNLDAILDRQPSSIPPQESEPTPPPIATPYDGRAIVVPLTRTTDQNAPAQGDRDASLVGASASTNDNAGTPASGNGHAKTVPATPAASQSAVGKPSKSNSTVRILIILAILTLVGLAIWWFSTQSHQSSASALIFLHMQLLLYAPTIHWKR